MAAIAGVPISGDHDVFISVDVDFTGRAISNLQLLVALTVTGTGFSFSGGLIGGRYLAGSTTTQQRKNAFAFLASPKDNAPAITSPNLHDFGEASPLNTFVGKVGLIWRRDGTLEFNPYDGTPDLTIDLGAPMAAGSYTFGLTVWGDGGSEQLPFMSPELSNFTIEELEGDGPDPEPGPSFWTGYVNCTES